MQITRSIVALSALSLVALATSAASASVTLAAGQAQIISPPPSCVPGALSGFNAFAWNEQTNVSLTNLPVDMTNNPGSSGSAISGFVGGAFDSHFIHYENIPGVISASGSFTFSSNIIAVIFTQPLLDLTDSPLGIGSTIYPTGYTFRGLNSTSSFTLNNNLLTFNFVTFTPTTDVIQLRVLTHVPTPGASLALSAAGILTLRRRRK